MDDLFNIERVHKFRIERLVELFGNEGVADIYQREREKLEKNASVQTFIPMLTYKRVVEVMEGKYDRI